MEFTKVSFVAKRHDHGVLIFVRRPIALAFILLGLAAMFIRAHTLVREGAATAESRGSHA